MNQISNQTATATAAALGAAAVTLVNVVFGWHPSIEVLGAENVIAAFITGHLPHSWTA